MNVYCIYYNVYRDNEVIVRGNVFWDLLVFNAEGASELYGAVKERALDGVNDPHECGVVIVNISKF